MHSGSITNGLSSNIPRSSALWPRPVYIKPISPQLNGKVERSFHTENEEFHQLLTYTNDVDLNKKLAEWERFYNLDRPHGAFKGKTPYEALRSKLV